MIALKKFYLLSLLLSPVPACLAQDAIPVDWRARLADMRLYRFSVSSPQIMDRTALRYSSTISWKGVDDRERSEHFSRMGGPNVPKRLGHVIVSSIMSFPENRVVAFQAQPFRPVDRIALRPDQLYYRYRKPWQPGIATLRNSARRNMSSEFGPDLKSFVRLLRLP
jgi:hypothetical protein